MEVAYVISRRRPCPPHRHCVLRAPSALRAPLGEAACLPVPCIHRARGPAQQTGAGGPQPVQRPQQASLSARRGCGLLHSAMSGGLASGSRGPALCCSQVTGFRAGIGFRPRASWLQRRVHQSLVNLSVPLKSPRPAEAEDSPAVPQHHLPAPAGSQQPASTSLEKGSAGGDSPGPEREHVNRPGAPAGLLLHWQSSSRAGPGGAGAGLKGAGPGSGHQGPRATPAASSCCNAFWSLSIRHSDRWVPSLRRRPDHTPLHWAGRLRSSRCHFAIALTSALPHNPQWNILDKPTVSKVGTKGATLTRVL